MAAKKLPKVIRVSFKDNECEEQLYNDILDESKLVGQSAWMKIAAKEKLDRDKGKVVATSVNNTPSNIVDKELPMSNAQLPQSTTTEDSIVINSLDDLFK